MKTNLWWKWLLIAVLVLASIVFTYPASDWVDEEGKTHLGKIRLGLDLKGGYSSPSRSTRRTCARKSSKTTPTSPKTR